MTAARTLSTDSPDSLAEPPQSFWTRIAHEITEAIGRGLYAPGERLPSEHMLAMQFGVNRHTIRRSLASLAQNGLVRSSRGSGTYVDDFAIDLVLGKRTRHSHSLTKAGVAGAMVLLTSASIRANQDISKALELRTGAAVLHLQVLGEGAGQPLHYSDRYFPLPRFARLDEALRLSGSITQAFAGLGVADYTRRASRISSRMPSHEVSKQLKQHTSRPALYVNSVNVDMQDVPIEYACTWFSGDRVTLTVDHQDGN
jgi:GntR family transcriptional regulator, phosphonate transport system regulatory protein